MVTRVIIVRHGESTFNAQRRVQGHCDQSNLTETGQAGAIQVGNALKELSFAATYSSPLQRAKETAELILSQLGQPPKLKLRDDLKEINLVEWEGLFFQEVEDRFPEGYACWRDRPHELKMRSADGTQDFYPVVALYEQARQFWQAVLPQHPDQTILVVAHSGINRCLIGTALGLGVEYYPALYQSNCGISVLNFSGGLGQPVQLESMNLTGHLDQPLPAVKKNRGVRLLLVRHGETDWNRQKRFQGQIDVPLNEQGKVQAQQAAEFLQHVPIDRAITSPLLRPKQTAEFILQKHPGLSLELDPELQEISHGLWEGKLEAEIEQGYPGLLQQWQQSPETVQMPEGENLQQVWQRSTAAWEAIVASTPMALGDGPTADRPTTVMVVAHDAVNKAILCHVVGQSPAHFWTFKQGNGAVSVIDYPQGIAGKPVLQAMNITTHLGGVLDKTAAGAL
ncbi:MAG: histidine phosphatase family protein [Leptolyngbyaceae cyanobacterium CRU_2_3]|nr:histidine phosphatase family protein [Leptolyngbyaceae cyanobacterium CRU_2_3]